MIGFSSTALVAQLETVAIPQVEWSLLWPILFLAVGGVVLVTITSLVPGLQHRGFPSLFTAAMAIAAGGSLFWIWDRVTESGGSVLVLAGALRVDYFTIVITGIICIGVLFAAMFLDDYLRREGLDGPEWYVLILLSASGGVLMAAAEDLIVTFLGLEILSIAVYVLAALHLRRTESQEAGFKYFVLGALSSAFFLYGIALVYGATGSTTLTGISNGIVSTNARGLTPAADSSLLLAGMALLLVGFGFKVSAAPFHLWTPDVYQGSPTPVVGFMASAVKVAGFAGLLRVFITAFGRVSGDWLQPIGAMSILSLVIGSFLAIRQENIKRMLAYSSISHAGFILIGVYAAGSSDPGVSLDGGQSVLFYLFAYTIMVAGSFGVATVMGKRGDGAHNLSDYNGLARTQPLLSTLLVVLLLAQAGIPFTSGFFAKFGVIAAAVRGGAYELAGAAMIAAVVAAYLYLKVIVAMFLNEPASDVNLAQGENDNNEVGSDASTRVVGIVDLAPAAVVAIGIAAGLTLLFGIQPGLGADILRDAASSLQ